MYNAVVFNVFWEVYMQTVLIAIRNYADDDSGNVDIHSRLTVNKQYREIIKNVR